KRRTPGPENERTWEPSTRSSRQKNTSGQSSTSNAAPDSCSEHGRQGCTPGGVRQHKRASRREIGETFPEKQQLFDRRHNVDRMEVAHHLVSNGFFLQPCCGMMTHSTGWMNSACAG